MIKPRLLDAYCGIGGAGRGYQMAGFHVTGVDVKAQPRYAGDAFIQADAIEHIAAHGHEYDAIHASPPCQAYSVMKSMNKHITHPDLVGPTRDALEAIGKPWVIENVVGAPVRTVIMLCGSMFGLRSHRGYLQRHRLFESNLMLFSPGPCRHDGLAIGVYGHGSAGHLGQKMRTANVEEARILMDMPWSTRDGLSQAIPPAYTKWIGDFLMTAISQPASTSSGDPSGHVIQMGKKSTLPAFVARLRAANPGARFAMSEANIALLGPAPDLEAHRRLRDDEALILERTSK